MTEIWGVERVFLRRGSRTILHDVSVRFSAGSVSGVIGPNGTGKSSLLRVLSGWDRPSSGWVLGDERAQWREPAWAERVSAVIGGIDLGLPFCVEEVLLSAWFPLSRRWLDPSSERRNQLCDLLAKLELFPEDPESGLERTYSTLSAGERQLVDLARGILHPGRVLILDEPASALDIRHRLVVRRVLREQAQAGRLVIMSLHDLNEAKDELDHVVVLHRGAVATAGDPGVVLTSEILKTVWGVEPMEKGYRLC